MKSILRKIIPNVIRKYYSGREFIDKEPEEVFTQIFDTKRWVKGGESVSGSGSELAQTELISHELPRLFEKFDIRIMLDLPCGDFHWMKRVITEDLDLTYIGADIVKDIIAANEKAYSNRMISFQHLNLIEDVLPKVDLIFCRDCLVHLCYEDIKKSIGNIIASDSKYLMTTTFVTRKKNRDIVTGNHRPLNFAKSPFNFPEPLAIIHEYDNVEDVEFRDKSLALWRVEDLKDLR